MTAENATDRLRIRGVELGDVESELEAGPPPVDPQNLVAETSLRQLRTIDGRREGDDRVGMKMVDVHGIDERMHGGIDAGRCSPTSEQAVVEETHHLVFVLGSAVHTDEAFDSTQFEDRQPGCCECPEVAARAFDEHDVHLLAGRGVERLTLGRCVAACVVGVAPVAAEAVASR